MSAAGLTRRELLRRGSYALAASALWLNACRRPLEAVEGERILLLLGASEALDPIGRVYLQQTEPQSKAGLLRELGSDLAEAPWEADDLELGKWLKARIESDFHHDQVVWIQGWELSLTEARLCALAALREPALKARRRSH